MFRRLKSFVISETSLEASQPQLSEMAQPMEVDESFPMEYDSDSDEANVDIEKFVERPEDAREREVDAELHDKLQREIRIKESQEFKEPPNGESFDIDDEDYQPVDPTEPWSSPNTLRGLFADTPKHSTFNLFGVKDDAIPASPAPRPPPTTKRPFKLCMVRTSNPKAVTMELQQLTYKNFKETIHKYLITLLGLEKWVLKVFVNEENFKKNKFTLLGKEQSEVLRDAIWRTEIQPHIKSGEFCYVSRYYSSVIVYPGIIVDPQAPVLNQSNGGKFHPFSSPDGNERDAKGFADLIWVMTGVDPQTHPKGVVLGNGQYKPQAENTYRVWNSSMNHEEWRKNIWLQLDRPATYVFLPGQVPDFEISKRTVEDALKDIKDDKCVSHADPVYEQLAMFEVKTHVTWTRDPLRKTPGSTQLDKATKWHAAYMDTKRAERQIHFEDVQARMNSPPSEDVSSTRGTLAGIRKHLQDVEDSRDRFVEQQKRINADWNSRQAARVEPERVYGLQGKIGIPKYNNTVEEVVTGGPAMPVTYARVLTAAEVEELRRRLQRVENELLEREEYCRVCYQTFRHKSDEVTAHYADHRASLGLKSALFSLRSRSLEGQASKGSNPISMDHSAYDFGVPKPTAGLGINIQTVTPPNSSGEKVSDQADVRPEEAMPVADEIPRPEKATVESETESEDLTVLDQRHTPLTPESLPSSKPTTKLRKRGRNSLDSHYTPSGETSSSTDTDTDTDFEPETKKQKLSHIEIETGLPTPSIDDPVPIFDGKGAETPTPSAEIKRPRTAKKPAKPAKSEKDESYRPNRSSEIPDEEEEGEPVIAEPESQKGKRKYCAVCWKCVHSFGSKKLKAHLKVCGVGMESVQLATKKEADLKKEGVELVGETENKGAKGKGKGKGK